MGCSLPLVALLVALLSQSPGWAAGSVIRDAGTLQLDDVVYRLDGIDAPELDQMCIDERADPWACGIEARDRLSRLIGNREVSCDDQGTDPATGRHLAICRVEDDKISLNQLMVRQGFAISVTPGAGEPITADQDVAKDNARGLWSGCFVAPEGFRRGQKDGALLGDACRSDKDREIRAVLFPDHPAMPPGCSIKAKFAVRARVTGNVGIYQLQGCRGYPSLTTPDRWFCSADDAEAAGFRRAYNCQPAKSP